MSLKDQLAGDLKDSMRARDEIRTSAIRLVIAGIKNGEIAAGKVYQDPEVLGVIAKQVKQHRESIEGFQKGARQDLVDRESAQMKVLLAYLPPSIGRDEIAAEARRVIEEVGARGPSDKGKVMQALMPRLSGRAEGREINEVVTELLANLA